MYLPTEYTKYKIKYKEGPDYDETNKVDPGPWIS